MRDETKRQFVSATAFGLPIVLVVLTNSFLAPAPRTSTAAMSDTTQATVQPNTTTPTREPRVLAAADHVRALATQPFGPVPLVTKEAVVIDDVEPEPEQPTVAVQAILASPRGNTALIGGRPYRVGDFLGDTGWSVRSIDSESRSVVIAHEDGRVHTLVVQARFAPGN